MSDWIILRMAASSTLNVAKSLADAGYEVWTPIEVEKRRAARSRKRIEREVPLMPTFVFARCDRLGDLVALSKSPALTYQAWDKELQRIVTRGCPYFRVFRYLDGYPRIADRHLDPLRQAEQRRKTKGKSNNLMAGAAVRYPAAGFEGLTGTVQVVKGRYALVVFPDFNIPVQIEAGGLLPVKAAA